MYNDNMYKYIKCSTTTIISGRPTRFNRRASHHGQARNTFSSFRLLVLPIPASSPMPSSHFMCMALPPTERTHRGVVKKMDRRMLDSCVCGCACVCVCVRTDEPMPKAWREQRSAQMVENVTFSCLRFFDKRKLSNIDFS